MTACSAHLRLSRCPLTRYTLSANLHVIYVCMRALRRSRLTGALSVGADGPLFAPCSSLTVQSYVAWIEPSGTQVRLLHRMRFIAHALVLCACWWLALGDVGRKQRVATCGDAPFASSSSSCVAYVAGLPVQDAPEPSETSPA